MKIKKIIHNKSFYHVYQPIYLLSEWRILGFESFFRSNFTSDPEGLFQFAMKTNNLYELDTQSIMKSVLDFYAHPHRYKHLLFVNVFPSTLLNPSFFSFINHMLKKVTINCHQIVFEINEAEKIENIHALNKVVSLLRDYGFLIAIDDVGKGRSDIQKIIELEPNFIKLDRYFSINLSQSSKKQQLIHLLMDFSKNHSKIILEGIENPVDLATTKALGIPLAQGFLLGKPEISSVLKDAYFNHF